MSNQKVQALHPNFKPFIIAFSIGISIYFIYIYNNLSAQIYFNNFNNLNCSQQNEKSVGKIIGKIKITKCGRFPALADLNVSDIYWQVRNTTNGTFYLFNAYFDNRDTLKNRSVVRILGLINRVDPVVKTYCQMWYDLHNEPIVVDAQEYRMIWPKYWGVNTNGAGPYLITCPNPLDYENLVPKFVSIVENKCEYANNIMEIRNKKPLNGRKQKFLISVKGLDFQNDVSILLIEWCEILKIFGVNMVEIFIVNVHPNVLHVLKFYQSEKFVKIKFLKFPHELPNKASESWHQWSQNDLVPYHDSFYENLYKYEYMIPMDIDEFIVPYNVEDRTWSDLLIRTISKSRIKNETFDAFPVTNMYFLLKSVHENETIPGIPRNLRFLSNIYRSANFTPNGGNAKTFMRTDRILTVHNHFPLSCLEDDYCKLFDVPQEDGQLSHYRTDCNNPECENSKSNPIKDTTLWKYKDEILKNVNETLNKLENFKSEIHFENSKVNGNI